MQDERKVFFMYKDLVRKLDSLDDIDAGQLFKAILLYVNGEDYSIESLMATVAFDFIREDLDRAEEYHRDICEKRREAINKRWEKHRLKQSNTKVSDVNTKDTKVIQTHTNDTEKEKEKEKEYISKDIYIPFGQYGWVKLTESQHSKLVSDLGADEAESCITYVDEAAQSTGNKNKWKDWYLVVKRCHREGWNRRKTKVNRGVENDSVDFDALIRKYSAI